MEVIRRRSQKDRNSLSSNNNEPNTIDAVASLLSTKKVQIQNGLTMYLQPPSGEISMADIELHAYNRLQVLKRLESSRLLRGSVRVDPTEWTASVLKLLSEFQLNDPKADVISHFFLRLAYCKSEELKRWFIQQELLLFRARFESENDESLSYFLSVSGLDFVPADIKDPIILAKVRSMPFVTNTTTFYRVKFEDAFDLLRDRRVVLVDGDAYVPKSFLVNLVANKFRAHLSHQLALTQRAQANLKNDKRLIPLIQALSKQYVGSTYKLKFTGAVTRDQIPSLADRDFPLCMHNLYKSLRDENHLRHGGRMQFGLFLKAIGLSMEEALIFWKQAFARRTPPEKFDKQYAYNIRHNYGKEGKRTSYTPYGCMKIIHSQPGAGDHEGCPFKHFDEYSLKERLRERKIPSAGIESLLQLVHDKHYQVACKMYFSLTHGNINDDTVGNHPNAYFDASIKYYQAVEKGIVKPLDQPAIINPIVSNNNNNNSNSIKTEMDPNVTSVKVESQGVESFLMEPVELDESSLIKDQPVIEPSSDGIPDNSNNNDNNMNSEPVVTDNNNMNLEVSAALPAVESESQTQAVEIANIDSTMPVENNTQITEPSS